MEKLFDKDLTKILFQLADDIFKIRLHNKWNSQSPDGSKRKDIDPIDIFKYVDYLTHWNNVNLIPTTGNSNKIAHQFYYNLWYEFLILHKSDMTRKIKTIDRHTKEAVKSTGKVPMIPATYIGKLPMREIYFNVKMGGFWFDEKNEIPAFSFTIYQRSTRITIDTNADAVITISSETEHGKKRNNIKELFYPF